jgi:two-component system, OmpR family, copper resistance phosphate regulon response regulator CusR
MRILLVEDEQDAARMLAKGLREQSYAVDVAETGPEGLEKAELNAYDLLLLDVMLPGMDGMEVCRNLRRQGSRVPILLLTARGGVNDRISGLDCGADDYLTKPFDFGELLARIRALLRRGTELKDTVLKVGDLSVDTRTHAVMRAGMSIGLTAKEYALLEYLVSRPGDVVTRADISEHVWEESYDPFSNLIEVYVQRLRRKLDARGGPPLLHTRRGEGYVLSAEQDVHV